jgi:hypothetical protein
MNHFYRLASTLVIAASAALIAVPALAQISGSIGGNSVSVTGPGISGLLGGGRTFATSPTIGGPMPGVEAPANTGPEASAVDVNASAAQGNETNSNDLLTGHEAIMGPVVGQGVTFGSGAAGSLGIPSVGQALMAPNSVDMTAFPSGQFHYGFPNNPTTSFTGVSSKSSPSGGFLSPAATSSVDINTVDCPFLRESYSNGGSGGLGNINLAIPLGGGNTLNTSINPVQTINQLNNFFGGP